MTRRNRRNALYLPKSRLRSETRKLSISARILKIHWRSQDPRSALPPCPSFLLRAGYPEDRNAQLQNLLQEIVGVMGQTSLRNWSVSAILVTSAIPCDVVTLYSEG